MIFNKRTQHLLAIGICFFVCNQINAMLLDKATDPADLEETIRVNEQEIKKDRKRSLSSISSELVDFSFQQKNLKDLLNDFAQRLNINILYPETEAVVAKVSFDAGRKITMTEAWEFVVMILEQAGYTLVLKGSNTYVLLTNSKSYKEPLPLYIGVDFNQLPDSMQRIRYIYYFSNIQVAKQSAELQTILGNILPVQDLKDQLMLDSNSNSMILTTRADMIKTVMQLISVLDETGFQQAVELLPLKHAQAKDIVELFKSVIGGSDGAKKSAGFVSLATGQRARYFSDLVRVENLDPSNTRQLNTVIVMGKLHDIEEIKKFIKKYLDIPQEEGKSFFHVVELQWIQAAHFANVLTSLTQAAPTTSGQSAGSISSDLSFDPHIKIVSETISQGNSANTSIQGSANLTSATSAPNTVQRGANKLIVACSARDWNRIEALIKQLDIPQKQVIVEALVIDLGLEFIRKLGSQIRTRGLTANIFPKNMQAQAGLLINNVIQPMSDPDYYSLVGDLSDILNPDYVAAANSGGSLTQPNVSQTIQAGTAGSGPAAFTGSTIFMLNGNKSLTNGAWAFFQMLSQHFSSKVFTRPMVMVMNNQQGSITSTATRNVAGSVTAGQSNPTVNYTMVPAKVTVTFTPLISDNNTVNLQLNINLNTFSVPDNAYSGDMKTRGLQTNVSMKSGDVLILGGLIQENIQVGKRSVPFFESIPVVGNLFASRTKDANKTQLFVLVRPTVVTPRMQGGMNPMTQAAADFMVDQLADTENAFANLKDPVTRWFFNSDRDETASEVLEEKFIDLPKIDFGQAINSLHPTQDLKIDHMKIGWFSDEPSNDPFASDASKETDSEKLARLLKDVQNPFEKRVQL